MALMMGHRYEMKLHITGVDFLFIFFKYEDNIRNLKHSSATKKLIKSVHSGVNAVIR